MKIYIAVLLVFVLDLGTVAQFDTENRGSLEFSGTVRKIEINKYKTSEDPHHSTPVFVTLKMRLSNTGLTPVILLRTDTVCMGANVAKTVVELRNRSGVFASYDGFNSSGDFIGEKAWGQFKKRLNKPSPPSDLTEIIRAGESIEVNLEVQFNLPTEQGKRAGLAYSNQYSLDELKQLSPLLVSIYGCEFRNYGMENDANKGRIAFSKRLQKRWSNSGFLWLDQIDSKPISLDMNQTVSN
jgi:hypothetical protein